jgi:Regulator of chromosome condensation (RCC1) repeat
MSRSNWPWGVGGPLLALASLTAFACDGGDAPTRPCSGAQLGAEGSQFVLRRTDGSLWTWGAGVGRPQPVTEKVPAEATFVRGTLCVRAPDSSVSCPFFVEARTVVMTFPNTFEVPTRDVSILGAYGFDATPLCVVSASSRSICRFGESPETLVDSGLGFTMVAVGQRHECGLQQDGTVACQELTTVSGTPKQTGVAAWGTPEGWTAALSTEAPIEIVSTKGFSCVLTDARAVVCRGGQRQFRFTDDGDIPVRMEGFTPPVAALTAGGDHVCAIVKDGDIVCWGDWFVSEMLTPTKVAGLPRPAISLASAIDADCAILDDSSVWCWGSNLDGERGTTTAPKAFPPTPLVCD